MRNQRSIASFLLLALVLLGVPAVASAGVFVSVGIAPPILPVYAQPMCPGPGYIWTPGYWAWGDDGYYWVPGTWVFAPYTGALWTPGYWGWGSGVYLWHPGYWGLHVGFYGGVNYGFGYGGFGYMGGRWDHGIFSYNRAVNNVNVTNIHNVYNQPVARNMAGSRVSYNGGRGGLAARPSAAEQAAANERHTPATGMQAQHERAAAGNRALLASVNHGNPSIAATARPGAFSGAGVTRAGGAPARNNMAAGRGGSGWTTARSPHTANNTARPMTAGRGPAAATPQRGTVRAAPRQSSAPGPAYRAPSQHASAAPRASSAPHSGSAPHGRQR